MMGKEEAEKSHRKKRYGISYCKSEHCMGVDRIPEVDKGKESINGDKHHTDNQLPHGCLTCICYYVL
jgi:hypothetical protein